MKQLWSPWRMEYVQNNQNDQNYCVFCNAVNQEDGPGNQIIFRGENVFAILNRYPYTSGHLMIVPYQHTNFLNQLSPSTRAELMELTNYAMEVLNFIYHPEGFNAGMNIGKAAGAGIAEHIHLHIVPRWNGDTNFMSTIGEVRVLPESLEDTYYRIVNAWHAIAL